MKYSKDGLQFKDCLNEFNEGLITENSTENEENNNKFSYEFEKIFCSKQTLFQNDKDSNYIFEKSNLESVVKTVEANLISLEKQIDNLKVINTNLQHVNILYQLNDISENVKTTINERRKALLLKERLVDKLIYC